MSRHMDSETWSGHTTEYSAIESLTGGPQQHYAKQKRPDKVHRWWDSICANVQGLGEGRGFVCSDGNALKCTVTTAVQLCERAGTARPQPRAESL